MRRLEEIEKATTNFRNLLAKFPDFRYVGDKILRENTKPVSVEEGIKIATKLGGVLVDFRSFTGYGRGLAAPQIGIPASVFVTFIDGKVQGFINPRITSLSGPYSYFRELCLSAGIYWGDVKRKSRITMEWIDLEGNPKTGQFDGFLARLYEHECGHTKGELNLDIAEEGSIEIITEDPLKEELREKPLSRV